MNFYVQKISQDQPANYLWELCGAPAQYDMPLLKAEFSVDYRLAGTTDWKIFSFNFDIVDYAVRLASANISYVCDS